MSFYKSAIIVPNVVNTWGVYLSWRQMRSHDNKDVPEPLKDVISTEEFTSSQSYGKERLAFSLLSDAKDIILFNAKLFLQLPAKLYYSLSTKRSLRTGSFVHGWLFSVILDAVTTLVEVPFSYYSNFVIEKKHGFNKMSGWEFTKDIVKTFLLKAVLLHPIQTSLVHFIVSKFGEKFPLYFIGAGIVIAFVTAFIFPIFIAPMFNAYSPLDEKDELFQKIKALADKVGFPLKKIYIVDGSRRSSHSNAYLYGFWKNKRIVIYDTLLQQKKDDEQLLAVLCHEFGHWKHGHFYANMGIFLLELTLTSYGARSVIFNQSLCSQFGFEEMDPVIGFIICLEYFLEPLTTVLGYGVSKISRKMEFEADQFAVSMGYGTKLWESLLVLATKNKSSLTPDPLFSALIFSHPPIIERLNAIMEEEKKRN